MKPITLMINGLPGDMARTVAGHALLDPRFTLLPFSLTGPAITQTRFAVGSQTFALIRPEHRDDDELHAALRQAAAGRSFIAVDFSHPTAVNTNAAFYAHRNWHFVMGTTGGERESLVQTVEDSPVCAVIAPNMAKPIVGLQAMIAYAAETFPGILAGFDLSVRESHQQGKADTSGTAKALIASFQRLGVAFDAQKLVKERDPAIQAREWQIPEEHLKGHGWHTYTLDSQDQTVRLAFTHNVNGRDVYALGTLDACRFLSLKIEDGEKGRVFSMIDVLKSGINA